jgi:hypothetical protein
MKAIFLGVLAAAAVTVSAAQAQMVQYKATLSGAQEVPPVQSAASGAALVNADPKTGGVSWSVTYSGLSGPPAAAHIHCGAAAGANAGVAVNLGTNLNSPIQGTGTMTPPQMADLQGGKCYVNFHTAANKNGEVRGQLTH